MTSGSPNSNKVINKRRKKSDEAENSILLDTEKEIRKETAKITSTDILSRNGSLQIVFHCGEKQHLIQFSKNVDVTSILKSALAIIPTDSENYFEKGVSIKISNDKRETSTSISAQEDFDSEITELVHKIKTKAIGNRISVSLEQQTSSSAKVEVIDLEPEDNNTHKHKRKSVEGNTNVEKGVSKSVVAEPISARVVTESIPDTVSTTTSAKEEEIEAEVCPVGLKNLSMTCFINVILQSLSNSPPFRKFIEKLPVLNSETCSVISELRKLLSSMWYGRKSIESPMALISAMRIKGIQYEFGIEEDAHWFLQTLIQIIDEELVSELGVEYSIIELFATTRISELKCEHCNKTDTQICELSTVNTLGLTTTDDICTLEECIVAKNTSKSELTKCNLCESLNINATRYYSMSGTPPPVLCYHFDRYKWTGQVLRRATRSAAKAKVQTFVFYPEDFDISEFIKEDSNNEDKKQYKLTAVIVHDGLTPISGHYFAFCNIKGIWYKCDDKNIVEVPRETVFQSNPFMLFYSNLYSTPLIPTTSTSTTTL